MSKLSVTIYGEAPRTVYNYMFSNVISGSLYSDGLYLADDSADPTSSTLSSSGSLVNYKYHEASIVNWQRSTNESIGVDLGTSKAINEIILIDDGTAGPGINWSGSRDSGVVYGSSDNAAWTKLRSFKPIKRTLFSGSLYQTNFDMVSGSTTTETYRYFKVYGNQGSLVGSLTPLVYTQIVAMQTPEQGHASGSIYREYTVTGVPNDSGAGTNQTDSTIPIGGGDLPSFVS